MNELMQHVRTIADFPTPGIQFRDLTPLMADAEALRASAEQLCAPFRADSIALVAGIEARGFIFGALVARELGVGFVPLRKPGKLPGRVEAVSYALEYGSASLEIHSDALEHGARVLLIDDVLATGGTAAAAAQLLQRLGAQVAGFAFLLEIAALNGRARLPSDVHTHSVLQV
jgi:adenine phosphoribosyltransferase